MNLCVCTRLFALLKVFGDYRSSPMHILTYNQLFNQECDGWSGSQRGVALEFGQH